MSPDVGFTPPGSASPQELKDGRREGDWPSRYPGRAWFQIGAELVWLLFALSVGVFGVVNAAVILIANEPLWILGAIFGDLSVKRTLLLWLIIGLSGLCGGVTFALKWHYHSVAKFFWNCDRVIWRVSTPLISAVLATFTGAMIVSGIVPFVSDATLDNPITCMGFGFFVGWFSDNLLAKLRRVADRFFGTMGPARNPDDGGGNPQ